jgi:hypothetical protein
VRIGAGFIDFVVQSVYRIKIIKIRSAWSARLLKKTVELSSLHEDKCVTIYESSAYYIYVLRCYCTETARDMILVLV